jgi:hypothetical protein
VWGSVVSRAYYLRDAANPLLQRRGGCAINKSCEATVDAQTGGSPFLTTPSAPDLRMPSAIFFEVASTPPLEEGISSGFTVSSVGRHCH